MSSFFTTGISSTTLTSLSVVFTPTRCYRSSVTFGVLAGAAIPAVLLMVNPNWPGDFTFPNSYLWFAAMSNSYRVIYSSVPISHSLAPSGVWYPLIISFGAFVWMSLSWPSIVAIRFSIVSNSLDGQCQTIHYLRHSSFFLCSEIKKPVNNVPLLSTTYALFALYG